MSVPNSSILKMNNRDTVRFLELYESEPVLWNLKHLKYHQKDARDAAAERVADKLNIENFTEKHVVVKFKNLRSSYLQEIKKIKESTKSECSSDDVYVPKVVWFPIMDRFLKPHVKSRNTRSNLNVQMQDPQDTQIMENIQTQEIPDSSSELDSDDNPEMQPLDELMLPISNEAQTIESEYQPNNPSTSFKRKMRIPGISNSSLTFFKGIKRQVPHSLANNSRTNKSRATSSNILQFNEPNIETTLLDDISVRDQTSVSNLNGEDHLDHFGKYIVSMLRNLPASKSFILQQKIISLVMEAQPVSVTSDTATIENVTSDGY